ncbi:MAG: putative immunity protein [Methanoculleus sp.]|jgi:hypothetical protein
MKKYSRQDQTTMAAWAADCAERVLPLFEEIRPEDNRPRDAIEACRAWVRTGVFTMAGIRGTSLGAHAAARDTMGNDAACFAARAAGQAVATAHVPQHAYGAAYYALKAVAAAEPTGVAARVGAEREWQSKRLPERLREEIMTRIVVLERGRGVFVRVRKGDGF